ncbi:MAG: helix-turn-helix transcriptional regulator [Firmicutes bacterium]|nr:helix-turn-helix transcriptional regulator [Bacillota bacterium]
MRKNNTFDFRPVGRIIFNCRRKLGLTQQQAASALNCSLTHYSRLESGFRPSLEMLIALCDYYDLSIDELLKLHPSINPIIEKIVELIKPRPRHEQEYILHCVEQYVSEMESLQKQALYRPFFHSDAADEAASMAATGADLMAAEDPGVYTPPERVSEDRQK